MMRDNRIMRTDRPGGNIRLFLCKMKKKKKEVENMKSKYRFRRILSGVMAAVTILSTVISPLTVYASEEPKAAEPPAYESVKDQLDENEVVKATDLELEVGQDFDVSTDFTNLEIKDESKVKVTFQKAENDAGENFSTSHADTYHAVYYVEPVNQNHPVYQIGRNLIVKEPVTAAQSEPQTEQAVTEEDTGSDDEEAASQEETETVPVETEIVEPETAESETEEPEETEPEFQGGLSESEFDAALEEAETENTTDKESGLTLSDVLEQAGEQDIDLMAMEDGETVSFTAVNTSTRATQDVDVTRGTAYYYADYGLGSYVTYKYTVKFGNVSATAYCVQPSKAGPGDGVYKITKLGDSKALAKVCYYGTKASGENGFFSEKHPDFSAGKQFIIVHLAASYANNSSDAFSGTNATGQALAMELYNYCMSQPEIPEVDMSFSNADVTAYISGNSQRTEASLAGAVFEVYAAEDIYTADHQKDENGNRYLEYAKDTLVATVTTDETGSAVVENLPLGKYRVEEKKTPEGYTWNAKGEEVTFTYAGQDTPVVDEEVTFTNERQKVSITVEKQDAETGSTVAGATFGLYNKNEIKSGDKIIVKADTLLQEITSDEKGQAHFTLDLPLGTYYVKEISAPDGFVSSDEILEFDATYQGQDIPTIKLKSVKKNQPTTIEVTKSDLTTGVELNGASLSVLDKDGNVIDSWTSVKDEPHVIKYLTVGKTYTLRESLAPLGYLKTTDVEFTVQDTAKVQKVEMKDDVPKALLIVNKKGEFLDKITLLDNVKGVVEHLFEYITGSLSDVTFEIYAAEDIKAADGVSPDYYAKDELVATVTTDANGVAEVSDLPVGKYYVKEVGTAYGYVLDEEPRYVDLSYRDQDTPVVVYDEDWQNNRQKVKVNVLKKEKDTDRVLKGGIFGLYTRNDILSASGKVLMEADTLIELKTTDVDGKISFIADLPIDGTYYVKELYAPDGFVTTGEEQEFVFEYQGDKEAEASYEFVFEDEPTTVELSKTDLTTGEELPGARLQLTDENGAVVEEWTSTKEPHIIKELVVGKSYTLTENKPADGYATAESITFTVENTAEIQKQVMEDDVTKVKISKTDITGDNEIEGAKLTITDENGNIVETWTSGKEPHYIEKLPIGKYTLKEEQAPNGYVVAEEITFEVADTAEIQKVAMKDDTAKGRLIIEKTDKDTGAALKDAEFELRDADGKVVETLTTDENGHATSGLLAIGTYKDGKFDKAATYYLVETKAPEGYQLDETKHEVTFTYVDDKTPVIEVIQKVTNEKLPEDTPFVSNPKTGDDTNLWIPALCLILSAGGLIGMGVASRRKKKKGGR